MILQVLRPRVAVLDEIDSGLDVDALTDVGAAPTRPLPHGEPSVVAITHFQRLLDVLPATNVHVFVDGRMSKSGDKSLATRLERDGYMSFFMNGPLRS